MKIFDMIKTANSNLLRNKLRTFLTILAIFIGSFTIILNTAISTGVNSFIDKQVESFGGEGLIRIMQSAISEQMSGLMGGGSTIREYKPGQNTVADMYISPELIEEIKKIDTINADSVHPVRNISVAYIRTDKNDKKFLIETQTLSSDTITIDMETGRNVKTESKDFEIALAPDYAVALGYTNESIIGETVYLAVTVSATQTTEEIPAKVVGVQAPSIVSLGSSWITGALADKIFNTSVDGLPPAMIEKASSAIMVSADFDYKNDPDAKKTKEALEKLGLAAMTISDQVGTIKSFFDVIIVVFNIFGAIALLAASIGIINTLFMAVQERTREIGLMKAMGLGKSKIFLIFSLEAVSLGFWGSVLGITISIIAGNIANRITHETILSAFPTFNLTEFTVQNCLILSLIIMAIAFLAGTLPARRAAKKDPIDALRYE